MREISIIKQNILKYIDYKGISKYEFYRRTGVSNGILSQSNGISEDSILKFLSYYTEVSAEWLLTGEGSMLKSAVKKEVQGLDPPDAGKLALLERENAMQAKIIAGLEFQVATLEKELYVLKLTQGDPIINQIVAKPAPELSK